MTKDSLPIEVFDLFDRYVHSQISRREFLDKASKYAVGTMTAAAMLDFLSPKYSTAQQVRRGDPRLIEKYVTYPSPEGAGTMRALLCIPEDLNTTLPGVVVVHENRGLNPHIEDVCRRVALAGFIGLAPDALTPLGGYPGTDDEGRELQRQRERGEMLEDFIAGYQYLKEHAQCTGRVGVVGFCFGGWISNMMAVHIPQLGAAVPFYGGQPDTDLVPQIQAPLLLHFAEQDRRVNAGWPAYEAALKEHAKKYTSYIYEGLQHGFHNDTTPRFDPEGAKLAWERTVAFFDEHLPDQD
ncbi:MAG: dienelactone hydrolase family protein [Rhodothermaceae bacterium]|nr:dienelactone hydrolase family protein [Rhodothermaceae bacterium]MXZ17706.1 dienelactone hydrolase family protein [Rhodothermaceae bacterium]MXZ58923.1 dienelactone hydrolase family protein [Rhodothermaceae bacterium]MYB91172.1 dienelactone hydrolase family protein [Rhodothermaceae bacterium]MYD67982.1 dienelactone hydrolase family protein [Rhodothermaceae bacterium]